MQNELIRDADHLQIKAEKSDVVFRMVDTFNRNTIHVTVTWQLKNNSLGRRRHARDERRPPPVALRDSGLVHDRPLLPDDPVLAGDEHELRREGHGEQREHHVLQHERDQGHQAAVHVHRADERVVSALPRHLPLGVLDGEGRDVEGPGQHRHVGVMRVSEA